MKFANPPNILGIDIGSVSISVAALNSQKNAFQSAYEFHHGNTAEKLREILSGFDLKSIRIKPTSEVEEWVKEHNYTLDCNTVRF